MTLARQTAPRTGAWQRNGWVLMPGFLSGRELATLRGEADRLSADEALFAMRGSIPNSPARSDRLDPVIDISEPFRALAHDRRLLDLATELLGDEAQLLKDKLILKPPGASGYDAHQDGAYWQGLGIEPGDFITAILFLDDCTLDKGPIECVPGMHARLLTPPGVITDVDEGTLGAAFQAIEASAGDLFLLHSLTPHRSGPNLSTQMRRTLLLSYGLDARPDLYGRYRDWRQAYGTATS